uniref:Transient receptor ion channel domain-containing protein n=1 Tax=Ciona savignyi TaxID=51511 RepID=H2ZES5_CIOSA
RKNGYRAGNSVFSSPSSPNEEEIRFLEAAEYGDIPTVREMLSSPTLNTSCVDFMEQNALQLACGNEHFEIVELLTQGKSMSRIGDALLLAISKGYLRIAELLMNHPSFRVNQRLTKSPGELMLLDPESDFYSYDNDGTRFSSDITPIILAAQCQEFDIVYELIRRGATIQHPHEYKCQCADCTHMRRNDALNYCLSRLNAYKGLASPVYLSLITADPVRLALKLSHELTRMADVEKEFKVRVLYDQQVQLFRLNSPEDRTQGENVPATVFSLSLIIYCTIYQTSLVVHTLVATRLSARMPSLKHKSSICVSTLRSKRSILILNAFVLFICTRTMRSPFCKFATHGMAHAQFLMLLVLNCIDRVEWFKSSPPFAFLIHQTSEHGRHTEFNWCEVFIMLYTAGLLWNEVTELWDDGPRNYVVQLWNILDFFLLVILITSFVASFISHQNRLQSNNAQNDVQYIPSKSTDDTKMDVSVPKWMNYYCYKYADRSHWIGSDPQLIAEALYSLGIVLSFTRICYILEVSEKFGPLQISLLSTVGDIIKWCGIFFMIFGAFLLGLFNLYSYYGKPEAKTTKAFTTIEETFITLFWSLFGLADYRGVEVKYDHQWTRIVGYQLYGAYNIITVVIMLNMLIAMINRSYSDVQVDSDLEWKFARAKLMMSYFDNGNVLPVPYNLVTIPLRFYGCVVQL